MDYRWTFRSCGTRYELVLVEESCSHGDRAAWLPGYQSTRLMDILQAEWYLKEGFRGNLPDRIISILDSFKGEAAELINSGKLHFPV